MENFDNIAYDVLQNYIENGVKGNLSNEMCDYMETLDLIRSLYSKFKTKESVILTLTSHPYNLSPYIANKRFAHAINLFYASTVIKKQSWRNLYADKLDKIASFILEGMNSMDDLKLYRTFIKDASTLRGLFDENEIEIPDGVLNKPNKVYSLDPDIIGLPSANKKELLKQIESLDIDAFTSNRLKEDMLHKPFKISDKLDEQLKDISTEIE